MEQTDQTGFFYQRLAETFWPWSHQFTIAEDGKADLMVYHVRDYKEIKGQSLGNSKQPCARVRMLRWRKDGFPDFVQEL